MPHPKEPVNRDNVSYADLYSREQAFNYYKERKTGDPVPAYVYCIVGRGKAPDQRIRDRVRATSARVSSLIAMQRLFTSYDPALQGAPKLASLCL